MDDRWRGLGLERDRVEHVRVPPEWLRLGAELAAETAVSLGIEPARVEHIGSTAVAGLLAKPIIDLALGMDDGELAAIDRGLTARGWIHRGDAGDDGGHVFVLERRPNVRVAHLHGVPFEGRQWQRYLALRRRLRSDSAARERYAAVKADLVDRHGNDRVAYTAGKTSTVNSLLAIG